MTWTNVDKVSKSVVGNELTQCGPYGDTELGQHHTGLGNGWWHQAITWANVDLSSTDSHAMAILPETPQPSITKISLKII